MRRSDGDHVLLRLVEVVLVMGLRQEGPDQVLLQRVGHSSELSAEEVRADLLVREAQPANRILEPRVIILGRPFIEDQRDIPQVALAPERSVQVGNHLQ